MTISHRVDRDILYIAPEGRIDASNAAAAEADICAIRAANPGCHTVLDADRLDYISSAGLRVILKLRREEEGLAIINVSPEVYDVLDMTGFTDMMTVEKAYRRLSVEGCEFLAKGANGAVYRYDAETVVKTYFNPDSLPDIRRERENARRAFVLGVNTAIPYDVVRVGEGYGTVAELLNATSITKLIRQNLEDVGEAVGYFVEMLKSIHATHANPGEFPDAREVALDWVDFVGPHLSVADGEKLRDLVKAVPVCTNLLHGDYHPDNVMVQNGEPLLIDLDTLCMGHPVFELGSTFNALVGFGEGDPGNTVAFFGFDKALGEELWQKTLKGYLGTEDEDVIRSVADKAMVVGYTRLLRRSIRRPDAPESPVRIARCKEMLPLLLARVDSLIF